MLFGTFFVLLLAGMPIVFAMGLASAAFLVFAGGGIPLMVIPHQMIAGIDNFPLLAIPFFFLAGELMNAAGITQRLVAFATGVVGHIRGGLAYVVVVTNVIMGGFSGTALADAERHGLRPHPGHEASRGYKFHHYSLLEAVLSSSPLDSLGTSENPLISPSNPPQA